ncbi:MAG: sulfatase-like hydrolase/transferase, partial [Planctomycetota bacterium]
MNRRSFLKLTVGAGASLWLAKGGSASVAIHKKPNIILVVIDELGYYELSCMGHPLLETPNIDRIAGEGMRFTQMLAGGPVCAPTRCCLMTGKHQGHASVRTNPGHEALRAEDVTVAQLLKKAGYATGGFGKWGCGGRGTTGVPEKHG